jgi:hypothetical protein
MTSHVRRMLLSLSLMLSLGVIAQTDTRAPRIWDDAALADWATPRGSAPTTSGKGGARPV